VPIDQLSKLKDKKDKLKSRLFMRKCEDLVFQKLDSNPDDKKPKGIFSLKKCKFCLQLFTVKQYKWMSCPNQIPNIDAHGKAKTQHQEDPDFKLNLFVQFMRKLGLTW